MPAVRVLTPWRRVGNVNEMAVAVDYPAAWADATGQPDEDIAGGVDLVIVQGEVSEAQLTAIRADSRYPVIIAGDPEAEPADLTAPEVDALRSELAAVVHPDVAKLATADAVNPVTIADALIDAVLRKPWRPGMSVKAGDVLYYERNLIEVISDHKTASHWKPNEAHSLYKRYFNPDAEPEPWVQPISAETAYPLGFRVLHLDRIWVSQIPANTTVPGSDVRWWVLAEGQEPIPDPNVTPEWVSGEQLTYSAANPIYRMYRGVKYQLRQSPGVNIWAPPTVPALWQVVPT